MPYAFGVVEVRGFGSSNPEQDTPYAISGVPGDFNIALPGAVRAHLVESEPVSLCVGRC
jgi:hypothetical protein